MPLHPQARIFLDEIAAQKRPDWCEMMPAEGREAFAGLTDLFGAGEPVHRVEELAISEDVTARVYKPAATGPLPAVIYFHGGGWVLGDRHTHDTLCRRLSNQAHCMVVSVDYRRAPEHKFPEPLDDCYAATRYVADHAAELQVDPRRVAVAGDSAGGNLAAAVALMARDRGGPKVSFQLLIYPVMQPDFETQSYLDFADGFGLTRRSMIWFWEQYLASHGDGRQPYAAPLLASDLRNLPPAHVITAEYDVLRDEGESFAACLAAAGVPTTTRRYPGLIHGFTHCAGIFDDGRKSVDDAAAVLRKALVG